jgi:hypothetical protein
MRMSCTARKHVLAWMLTPLLLACAQGRRNSVTAGSRGAASAGGAASPQLLTSNPAFEPEGPR